MTRRLALLALTCFACAPTPPGPDVVLVTLDTVRADRIGEVTPNLLALARRGVTFDRAYSGSPLTLPSHATLLTGLRPAEHGVRDNGRFVLSEAIPTVATAFRSGGWATGAFVGAFVLDARFGLARGFDRYDDAVMQEPDPLAFGYAARRGARVTDRALAWWVQSETPRFLWVHYYDVHEPRAPPEPFDRLPDPYDGELAYVDREVGRLLAGLGEQHPRAIVVVGDHGEALGEHGEATHGVLAYDATLHVPLVVVAPDLPAGLVSREFVRTVDVAPTLLRAAGLPALPGASGVALQDVVAGDAPATRVDTFEATGGTAGLGWSAVRGVRDARFKLTLEPEPLELFDTWEDPGELANLAGSDPATVGRLRALAGELEASASALAPAIDEDTRAALAALGYSTAPAPGHDAPPDPREFARALGWVDAARATAARGELAEAADLLEALAESPVLRGRALPSLAAVQRAAGRHDAAIDTVRRWREEVAGPEPTLALAELLLDAGRDADALAALRDEPDSARTHTLRAAALRGLGRIEESIDAAERALEASPRSDAARAQRAWSRAARDGAAAEAERLAAALDEDRDPAAWPASHELLAELLRAAGRPGEARRRLEGATSPPPAHRALLGAIAAERGELERAEAHYRAALRDRPYAVDWQLALAGVLDRRGAHDAAIALYDRVLAANPADATVWLDRGATHARRGDPEAAARDYAHALTLDPTLAEAHFNRALLFLEAGDDAAAVASLERAVALRPEYPKAHLLLARVLGDAGDPRAAEHAERALAIDVAE